MPKYRVTQQVTVYINWVLRSSAVALSEGEDIPETTNPVAETGDHGRHPKLPSEPQTGMATLGNGRSGTILGYWNIEETNALFITRPLIIRG